MSQPIPTFPAARAYIAKGIAVFPIVAADSFKAPATSNGLKDASTSAEQIEAWWQRWPDSNIGIATGAKAGFWVLDIDGEKGAATLAALEAENGALPETPEQTTARGRHICFAWDPEHPIKNSAGRIGGKFDERGKLVDPSGIDARGEGGYIVAAPSRHATGVNYTWHPERRPSKMAFAPAPAWLLELAEKKPEPPKPARQPQLNAPGSVGKSAPAVAPGSRLITPYGEKILREECEKIATAVDGTVEMTINERSFLVGTIVGAGEIKEEIARAALIEAGMKVCKPPWTIVQISEKVERAMSAGMAHPRVKPELPPRRFSAPAAKPLQQEKPAEATVVDIRQPDRGYTPDTAWERDIIRNEDGKIVARTKNAILFLMNHREMVGTLAYDMFARTPVITKRPPWEEPDGTDWDARPLVDNDVTWATAWLESRGLAMKSNVIHSACIAAAQRNSFNPAVDWLCDLKWDQKNRLDDWLIYYTGAEDTPYVRNIGRKFLIGAVARILRPGCKMDNMLVLEGPQYLGKSAVANILGTFGGRSFFTDELADIGSKDAAMQLQGVAIVELAELDQLDRSSINAIKAWLTRRVDRYRPPYGRVIVEAPRQSVLIGTMNPDGCGWMKDPTGGRRFWPAVVTSIDAEALATDQPQLWAEAVSAFQAGERWWLTEDDEISQAAAEQEARYEEDPWGDTIDNYVSSLSKVRTEAIMGEGCLNIAAEKRNTMTLRRIARHLKLRGWVRVRLWDQRSRSNLNYFVKPSAEQPTQTEIDL